MNSQQMTEHCVALMKANMYAAQEALKPKPKPKRDLSRPTLFDADTNGTMQIIDRNMQEGYVDLDEYMTLFNEYEEREARLREIKELLESGRPAAEARSIRDVLKTIIALCDIEG